VLRGAGERSEEGFVLNEESEEWAVMSRWQEGKDDSDNVRSRLESSLKFRAQV